MLKVTVVDYAFPPDDLQKRLEGRYNLTFLQTRWRGSDQRICFGDCDVLFIFPDSYSDDSSSTLHLEGAPQADEIIRRGGLIVVFLGGNARQFHIRNLVGIPPTLASGSDALAHPAASSVIAKTPFDSILSSFGNKMLSAKALNIEAGGGDFQATPFLRHSSNHVIGGLLTRDKGRCAYLPSFHQHAVDVVPAILSDVVPSLMPHLVYDDRFAWLQEDSYLMPSVLSLRHRQQKLEADFNQAKDRLSNEYGHEWSTVQEMWNPLLTASGDPLKRAVKLALEKFGFIVEDVDDYWATADPTRQKEEDLWCGQTPPEARPSQPGIRLAEVKSSGRGAASDDDYGALTKYLSRRKTEFDNAKMYGILAMNHFYLRPVAERPEAVSPSMVSDSTRDGVTLVTTWDIFGLVQRLLAGQLSTEKIRELLLKPGRLSVP